MLSMGRNLILLTDSYKPSHYQQLPSGLEHIFSYMEARGGQYKETVFNGLKYYLKEYLSYPITLENINEAEEIFKFQGEPFNREGWEYILNNHNGYLPLEIKAVDEDKLYPIKTVLMTIVNTGTSKTEWLVPWITGYMETLLLNTWYPSTVATKAYYMKQIILGAFNKSADHDDVQWQLHNFGARASTCPEAQLIGGMAHLSQFSGTDNVIAVKGMKHYHREYKGQSIPATEHHTITSWGKENEFKCYMNFLEKNKGGFKIACVLDSYDLFKAMDYVTSGEFKEKVESDEYPSFVCRPDSGNPLDILPKMFEIMENNNVAYTVNSKGYKVFKKYSIIWGDGIDSKMIMQILNLVIKLGYSAENIAFGCGGELMQKVNRDDSQYAIKCSAAMVDGEWRDVFKDPITDQGKKSKRGILTSPDLKTVFLNGQLV